MSDHTTNEIPYGYCHCGCGGKTNLADKTRPKLGVIKGEPRKFLNGHQARNPATYTVDESTGCWVWNGTKNQQGYGRLKRNGKAIPAHRYFWEMRHGAKIHPSMEVHHKCRNPSCVNPDHLEPLPHKHHVPLGRVAKLTQSDVDEIRRLRKVVSQKELARRYGVTYNQISLIQLHKCW